MMDYNTDRKHLVLPEYGRNIQNMVDYAKSIENREERLRCAKTIVKVMMQLINQQGEMEESERVCWDHLARMANYELDIDYPIEITKEEEVKARPSVVPYPMKDIKLRQYGFLLEDLMRKLSEMEDGPEKEQLISLTANQMRKNLFYWNKDALSETKIVDDLNIYTKGNVKIDSNQLSFSQICGEVSGKTQKKNKSRK